MAHAMAAAAPTAPRGPLADCYIHPGIGHTSSECNKQRSGTQPAASGSSHNHRGHASSVTEATRTRQLEAELRTAQASLRQYEQRSTPPRAPGYRGQPHPSSGSSSHQQGGYGYQQRTQWSQPPQRTQW